jgi:hypothetical protein
MISLNNSEINTNGGMCRAVLNSFAKDKNMTMADVVRKYNSTAEQKLSQQNLSAKLKRDSLYFFEVIEIAESLGYRITFTSADYTVDEQAIDAQAIDAQRATIKEFRRYQSFVEEVKGAVRTEIADSLQAMIDALKNH